MVTFRRYSPLSGDFERMRLFLQENCGSHGEKGRYPEFWEYAQVLPWYDYASSWRNGIWEEDGRIVAAAWFEDAPGTARLTTDAQHAGLFETVLNYAEKWLCSVGADGKKKLDIELPLPQDKARKEVLLSRGYRPDGAENWNLYDLTQPIPEPHFPDGFVLKRLAEIPESDFAALNTAIQQGFDHEGEAGPESLLMTQTAPHARPDLTRCVVAPNGDYACFAGLWYNDVLKCGYLEPLCTRPAYRGMGLARSVLYTQMREIRAMGGLTFTGGDQPFYLSAGYQPHHTYAHFCKEY